MFDIWISLRQVIVEGVGELMLACTRHLCERIFVDLEECHYKPDVLLVFDL